MPSIHGGTGAHGAAHRRGLMKRNPFVVYFILAESLFWAGSAVCFLLAASRAAGSMKQQSRLKTLKAIPDAFTEEEREQLVHKIKMHALGPF